MEPKTESVAKDEDVSAASASVSGVKVKVVLTATSTLVLVLVTWLVDVRVLTTVVSGGGNEATGTIWYVATMVSTGRTVTSGVREPSQMVLPFLTVK